MSGAPPGLPPHSGRGHAAAVVTARLSALPPAEGALTPHTVAHDPGRSLYALADPLETNLDPRRRRDGVKMGASITSELAGELAAFVRPDHVFSRQEVLARSSPVANPGRPLATGPEHRVLAGASVGRALCLVVRPSRTGRSEPIDQLNGSAGSECRVGDLRQAADRSDSELFTHGDVSSRPASSSQHLD